MITPHELQPTPTEYFTVEWVDPASTFWPQGKIRVASSADAHRAVTDFLQLSGEATIWVWRHTPLRRLIMPAAE